MKKISFLDVFRSALNARKGPLIPDGFILETPLESKPTPQPPQRQFESRQSSAFCFMSPVIPQPPESLLVSRVSQTPSGSVSMIRNDSTETLVNIITQPTHPRPILILDAFAHEVRQTRRISFADAIITPCPSASTDVTSMSQVAEETLGQGKDLRESPSSLLTTSVPEVRKVSRRKSILRAMSPFAPPVYHRGKARRSSFLTSLY